MVEGRYWSCGVGGLWGFRGGWPGRLERSQADRCGMDRARPGPWAGGLAGQWTGWDMSWDSPVCPVPLSGAPGSPSLAPWPNRAWLPLPSPVLPQFSPFPLLRPLPPLPPWHGSPFLSAAPYPSLPSSLPTPSFSPPGPDGQVSEAHGAALPKYSMLTRALCPAGWALSGWAPLPRQPGKGSKSGRGPSPPEEDVSSTINAVCLNMS